MNREVGCGRGDATPVHARSRLQPPDQETRLNTILNWFCVAPRWRSCWRRAVLVGALGVLLLGLLGAPLHSCFAPPDDEPAMAPLLSDSPVFARDRLFARLGVEESLQRACALATMSGGFRELLM